MEGLVDNIGKERNIKGIRIIKEGKLFLFVDDFIFFIDFEN